VVQLHLGVLNKLNEQSGSVLVGSGGSVFWNMGNVGDYLVAFFSYPLRSLQKEKNLKSANLDPGTLRAVSCPNTPNLKERSLD
jgi:hypothetical protein